MDCFAALAMTARHAFRISPRVFARGLLFKSGSLACRGRRECRALDAPAASRAIKNKVHERSHHEYTGTTRHSPRNGFTAYFVLSPVRRACLPPSPALLPADLTPASGCQDHTTSPSASAPFVKSASASTASRPASVTIAKRPLVGRDGGHIGLIWVRPQGLSPNSANIFFVIRKYVKSPSGPRN